MKRLISIILLVIVMCSSAYAINVSVGTNFNTAGANVKYLLNDSMLFDDITINNDGLSYTPTTGQTRITNYSYYDYLNSTIENKTRHYPLGSYSGEDIVGLENGTNSGDTSYGYYQGSFQSVYLNTSYMGRYDYMTGSYDTNNNTNYTFVFMYDLTSVFGGTAHDTFFYAASNNTGANQLSLHYNWTYDNQIYLATFNPASGCGDHTIPIINYAPTQGRMTMFAIRYNNNTNNLSVYTKGLYPYDDYISFESSVIINTSCFNMTGGGSFKVGGNRYHLSYADEMQFYAKELNNSELDAIVNYIGENGQYYNDRGINMFNITINTTSYTGTSMNSNLTVFSLNNNQTRYIEINNTASSHNLILTDDNYTVTVAAHGFDSRSFYDQELTYLNTTATYSLTVGGLIDNCTGYETNAINFSLFNATDNTNVVGNISGHFEVWFDYEQNAVPVNLSWTNMSNFSICMVDPHGDYSFNGQMEYSTPGFNTQTYYWTGGIMNETVELIDLYFIDDTTQVTFTVKDQDDHKIAGADIHILEYDISTDSTILVTVIRTDTEGSAIANVELNTKQYKFLIFYQGGVVLETSHITLTLTSYNFRINLLDNYMENYDEKENVICSMAYNNVTQMFTYTWIDPSGSLTQSCLNIIKRTGFGDIELNDECSTNTTGQLSYNLTNTTKGRNLFLGTGTFKLNNIQYLCGMDSQTYDDRYQLYGDTGIFMTFLIVLLLVLISLFSVPMAIIMSLLGIFVSTLLGTFYLSLPMLMALIIMGVIAIYKAR